MDTITAWLNAAGNKAIDADLTKELLVKVGNMEEGRQKKLLVNKICEGNLKLVFTTVKSFSNRRHLKWGTELTADLLQVGALGLHYAIGRYDPKRGTSLSTVAVPWIRQKLGRYMIQKEPAIYIPENLVREVVSLKVTGELTNSRTTPKNTQLIDLAVYASGRPTSLDMRLGNDNDDTSTLGDLIPQPSTEGSYAQQDRALLLLKDAMAKAGIEPKTQDLMVEYARMGRLSTAATRLRINPKTARRMVDGAIERIQAVH